ncbi:uncharacterized protein CLUP02_10644, partial [Colletotrichum lupini]
GLVRFVLLVCRWRGEGRLDKRGFRCVSFWEAAVQRDRGGALNVFVAGAWAGRQMTGMEVDGLA